jgi:hypothetical protein
MKKSNILVVALFGLLLVCGIVLSGCDKCPDQGTCSIQLLRITNPDPTVIELTVDRSTYNACGKDSCIVVKMNTNPNNYTAGVHKCDCN